MSTGVSRLEIIYIQVAYLTALVAWSYSTPLFELTHIQIQQQTQTCSLF